MRGCAGIAALNALRHPKGQSQPSVKNQEHQNQKIKSKKSNPKKNKALQESNATKIQTKKNQSTKARAGLCPADSRGGCPYVEHF
jgi:hypothetical protein